MTDNRPLDDAGMPLLAEALPRSLRNLIADDGYACTFQTMGQYRTALLKAFDAVTAGKEVTTPGLLKAAAFVEQKADGYADALGYGVAGMLCFDRQEKLDHYTTLTELAGEIRTLAAMEGA
jgi:hypothetical protein